jgi:hypothetical protein
MVGAPSAAQIQMAGAARAAGPLAGQDDCVGRGPISVQLQPEITAANFFVLCRCVMLRRKRGTL